MTTQIDAIAQFRGALKELASDPRISGFRTVKRTLELLDAAVDQLHRDQSAILEVQVAIASRLADAILRVHNSKNLHNVCCLEALQVADLERFKVEFEVLRT